VTLFSGRGLKIAVFADYHQEQKAMIDRLENSGLLPPGHLLRTSKYTNNVESDIEDVIGRELYIEIVNRYLRLDDEHKLPQSKPNAADERVVKQVEAHCRLLPPGHPEFNHYDPIDYLLGLSEQEIATLPSLDDALDRFERVFADLNSLLDSDESR